MYIFINSTNKFKRLLVIIFTASVFSFAYNANAVEVVAYDNFDHSINPNKSNTVSTSQGAIGLGGYIVGGGYAAQPNVYDSVTSLGGLFTPTINGSLSSFTVAIYGSSNQQIPFDNNVTWSIYAYDGKGGNLTNMIWSQTFSNQVSQTSYISHFSPTNGPVLQANTAYWLVADAAVNGSTEFFVEANAIGATGSRYTNTFNRTNPNYYRVAQIYSSTAPSMAMSISVTAVPEPESYAMLLAGLGLIGAAVKRRKAKQA